jgi:hypothetical protein
MFSNGVLPLFESNFFFADYTPIVINFHSGLLGSSKNEIFSERRGQKPKYYLAITVPRIAKRGTLQFIPDKLHLPVPEDGYLRFQLPPSTINMPFSRYHVDICRVGTHIPLDRQEWLVPPILKEKTYYFSVQNADDVLLPLYVWQVNALSPIQQFASTNNRISWVKDFLPTVGSQITVKYSPAVTLDIILEYSNQNLRTR